ncbi:MAG: DUF2520 domain-containing protein [Bacteroidia bacterium]|nr:MAG: DUF2520 domain-containing protein [Bacteroidia bacterium]
MTKTNIASKNQIIGSETKHIILIGAGNVATHISRHLYAQGHKIECVWSRTPGPARALAGVVGAKATSTVSEVPQKADFYILAIPDGAVAGMATEFADCQGIWLHTSGALSMDVFKGLFPEYGVLYPLQTLSRAHPLPLGHIPFLVEGSSVEVSEKVHDLASSISERVEAADSPTRLIIHLAAVFANNFSNHMVHIAHQILKEQNLSVAMLDPLLEETFQKITRVGAREAQTGPAFRDDHETMKRHIELLKNHPEWEKLYTFISREIEKSREE